MEKLVKLIKVAESREIASKTTGEVMCFTDMAVEWTVSQPGRENYTQSCACTVKGWLNREAINKLVSDGREILVTMYVNYREWNQKLFTTVDAYIPKEYLLDSKPNA